MSISTPPRWDMTVIYPGLDSHEFDDGLQAIVREIEDLQELFDRYHIEQQPAGTYTADTGQTFEIVANRFATVTDAASTIRAYVHSFVATDSRDTLAQARMSELQRHLLLLAQLETRLTAWIGSLDVDQLIADSAMAREHAFLLQKTKRQATHLMSPPEESLASEMNLTGGAAWGKLHGTVSSQLLVPVGLGGEMQELPMPVVRNLAYDPNRETRRSAYEAELNAWERVSVPLAAALNSIKGETNTLEARRGWGEALEVALFNNNIDRPTLDAMMGAAAAAFPDFRRYFHAKARALGLRRLAWYDLFAPVGHSSRVWEFSDAQSFLLDQFETYSPALRAFASRAFDEHWIDAEPRPGKRDGAFCMYLRNDESRVMSNYKSSFEGMSTLAHELGHAYHTFNLASRTVLQRETPMTLAETASIFCETIVREAALANSGPEEQLSILEASLEGSSQVVVDITSRFLFEKNLFEARRRRELSVPELNELMLDSQRQTYGDGLDESQLHPYMWAVKGHYYSAGYPFYNFPYMFGQLFGLGLYARYRVDPDVFRQSYDELLSSTGLADAATLAGRFDIDIRSPRFWTSSLDIIRQDIDRYVALVNQEASVA